MQGCHEVPNVNEGRGTACVMQQAAYNMPRATCNIQHAAHNIGREKQGQGLRHAASGDDPKQVVHVTVGLINRRVERVGQLLRCT